MRLVRNIFRLHLCQEGLSCDCTSSSHYSIQDFKVGHEAIGARVQVQTVPIHPKLHTCSKTIYRSSKIYDTLLSVSSSFRENIIQDQRFYIVVATFLQGTRQGCMSGKSRTSHWECKAANRSRVVR